MYCRSEEGRTCLVYALPCLDLTFLALYNHIALTIVFPETFVCHCTADFLRLTLHLPCLYLLNRGHRLHFDTTTPLPGIATTIRRTPIALQTTPNAHAPVSHGTCSL